MGASPWALESMRGPWPPRSPDLSHKYLCPRPLVTHVVRPANSVLRHPFPLARKESIPLNQFTW